MLFLPGKFYTHTHGRTIAVLDYIETFKWGKVLVIEETDHTGHGLSVIDEKDNTHDKTSSWTEIGKEEFNENFKSDQKRIYGVDAKVESIIKKK